MSVNPLAPVLPVTALAKTTVTPFPCAANNCPKIAHGTITFPILPGDCFCPISYIVLFLRTNKPIRMDLLSLFLEDF